MKEYLYWGQVQRRLSEHAERGEAPRSFYDAARELWEEGAVQTAEELPAVSFEDWDVDDLDEMERLLDRTPVNLSYFRQNFQARLDARAVVRRTLKLEGAPIRMAAHQAMGRHAHNVFMLLYVVRGQARLDLGSAVHTLGENTVLIISPNFYYDFLAEQGSLVLSIALSDQTVEDTLFRLLEQDNVLSAFFRSGIGGSGGFLLMQMEHVRLIRSIYRGILHECYTKGEYSQDIYSSYLEILFALLLRYCSSYEHHQEQLQGAWPMLSVLKYIQENFKDTTLSQVAEKFHYEPSYLGKQIKAATGKNYTDIIHDLRLEESKRLLRTTSLSVDEVADAVGYESRAHFFRSFRRDTGTTPGAYRKEKTWEQDNRI